MSTVCHHCGTRIQPAWKARVALESRDLTIRSLAEEAMEWFAINYPDSLDVILARRDALDRELHPRRRGT
jgi:hypothetical protein